MLLSKLSKDNPYLPYRITADILCASTVTSLPPVIAERFLSLADQGSSKISLLLTVGSYFCLKHECTKSLKTLFNPLKSSAGAGSSNEVFYMAIMAATVGYFFDSVVMDYFMTGIQNTSSSTYLSYGLTAFIYHEATKLLGANQWFPPTPPESDPPAMLKAPPEP